MAAHYHHFDKSSYAAKTSLKYRPPKVGYNTCNETQFSTDNASRKYSLLALPFEKVDGKGLSLNDLNFSTFKAAISLANADQILLWVLDPETKTYDYETWFRKSAGWYSAKSTSTTFDSVYQDGLPSGTVYWFAPYPGKVAPDVTTSGAVPSDTQVVKTLYRDQYNFVSYPYPCPLQLNNAEQVDWGNCTSAISLANADQIMIWVYLESSEEYDYETYFKKSGGWYSAKSTSKKFEEIHPEGVKVGTGFWYKPKEKAGLSETFDITFKSPIVSAE